MSSDPAASVTIALARVGSPPSTDYARRGRAWTASGFVHLQGAVLRRRGRRPDRHCSRSRTVPSSAPVLLGGDHRWQRTGSVYIDAGTASIFYVLRPTTIHVARRVSFYVGRAPVDTSTTSTWACRQRTSTAQETRPCASRRPASPSRCSRLVVALSGSAYAAAKSNGDAIVKTSSLCRQPAKANTVKGVEDPGVLAQDGAAQPAGRHRDPIRPLVPLTSAMAGFRAPRLLDAGVAPGRLGVRASPGWRRLATAGTDDLIGTLPVGHRPSRHLHLAAATTGGIHGTAVHHAGRQISYYYGDPAFMSLDGVTFYAGQ